MGKVHKWKDVVSAWANGADVQAKYPNDSVWKDQKNPSFDSDFLEYRIKPERLYPESSLTTDELHKIWSEHTLVKFNGNSAVAHAIATEAVKRHCQDQEKEAK